MPGFLPRMDTDAHGFFKGEKPLLVLKNLTDNAAKRARLKTND
jgi:hypothetical protein